MYKRTATATPKDNIKNAQLPRWCVDCFEKIAPDSGRHVRCGPCAINRRKAWRREWFKAYRKKNNQYFLDYAKKRRQQSGIQPFEIRNRANRKTRRQSILDMFNGQCTLCGYGKCVRSLHIHHIDPSRKTRDKDYQNKSFDDFANLIVLCSNCHFEVHDGMTKIPTK